MTGLRQALVAALLCGCAAPAQPAHDLSLAAAPVVRVPRVERTEPAAVDAGANAAVAPVRAPAPQALFNGVALARFFSSLAAQEGGTATDDTRILQLGDSHTAADWYTGRVRSLLQARFRDGGRGLVSVGKPWKGYLQDGVKVGMSREWAPVHARLVHHRLVGDGHYGLSGVAVTSEGRGTGSAWVDAGESDHVELAFLGQPQGGTLDVVVNGNAVGRVKAKNERMTTRFFGFEPGPGAHAVEVRSQGKARIFGAAFDKKSKGLVLDAVGRDGARAAALLQLDEAHFSALLRWRNPALVILAYGTNECGDKDVSQEAYERTLVDVLGRVTRAVPGAACLLLGPPDYVQHGPEGPVPHPRLAEIIAVQRAVAGAARCAFYDQQAAMGGPAAIAAWAAEDPPRARKDGVHLSREGYGALGAQFVDELVRAYGEYRITAP